MCSPSILANPFWPILRPLHSAFALFALSFSTTARAPSHAHLLLRPHVGEAYSFASDVWSVGLVLLEMAIGGYPYPQSANYFDLVKHIVDGPLPTESPQVHARDLLRL